MSTCNNCKHMARNKGVAGFCELLGEQRAHDQPSCWRRKSRPGQQCADPFQGVERQPPKPELPSGVALAAALFRAMNEGEIDRHAELPVGWRAQKVVYCRAAEPPPIAFERVAAIMQQLEPAKAAEATLLAEKVLGYLRRQG